MTDKTGLNLFCSFCRKSADAVKKLVAGPGVFICNDCVALCVGIIAASPEPERQRTPEEVRQVMAEADAQLLANMKTLESEALLKGLVASERAVEGSRQVLQTQIDVLREREISWAQIGGALGISRQAAWERFG